MAEKKENKKSAAVEMYFSRNQTNGLMYVLDCFVWQNNFHVMIITEEIVNVMILGVNNSILY